MTNGTTTPGTTTPGTPPVIGVIGGSGVYDIEGLENTRWRKVDTPFGAPSDELLFGELDGQPLVFLPRHGRGHPIPPSELNFRANIDALKRSGVSEILSLSAVGSLREELAPGSFVFVDQFIDRTFARKKSFFETGMVGHVAFGHPVCGRLGDHLEAAARRLDIAHSRGGTYLVMEGPQFSTIAESELYRSWGCQVIGMTNMPEAKLAPGPRPRHRRPGDPRAAGQRGQGPGPGQSGRAPAGRARRCLPPGLSHGPGQRAHHPAPGARPPGPGPARRRGRPRAVRLTIGAGT
jgi:5'-deoxy-5'-methylthioadenosine phosphorylase